MNDIIKKFLNKTGITLILIFFLNLFFTVAHATRVLKVGALTKAQYYLHFQDKDLKQDVRIGMDYDLIRDFSEKFDYSIEYIDFDSTAELMQALEDFEVDIAIGGLNLNKNKYNLNDYNISPAYMTEQMVLVSNYNNKASPELNQITSNIVTLTDSAYSPEVIDQIQNIVEVSETAETALAKIDVNNYNYLIVDKTSALAIRQVEPEVRIDYDVGEEHGVHWYLHKGEGNRYLNDEIYDYFGQAETADFISDLKISFINPLHVYQRYVTVLFVRDMNSKFLTYAPLFQYHAKEIDWRTAMAIGYQESRWKADAISPWGPSGLMMLTNKSARILKVKNKLDPEESIRAGVGFLSTTKKSLLKEIKHENRDYFAVAVYNMGLAKVIDARKYLAQIGRNNKSWVQLAENYEEIGKVSHTFKYGKVDGYIAGNYLRGVRKFYFMIVNYEFFVRKNPMLYANFIKEHGVIEKKEKAFEKAREQIAKKNSKPAAKTAPKKTTPVQKAAPKAATVNKSTPQPVEIAQKTPVAEPSKPLKKSVPKPN